MQIAALILACTTFCFARDGEALYGRNYDFEIGQGYVMSNRRGLQKTSVAGTLRWTSRYASVTFNQWGREFPMDGMNEAGFVVALMWLDETVYPPPDGRPSLRTLEWIQYQLDNYGSVGEFLEHAEEVRIVQGGTPLHYLVADASGDSAAIEFLEGKLVVHRGAVALANDAYERFLPNNRAARASSMMQTGNASIDRAFQILGSVAQPNTRWSVVYDMRRREISWVSDRNRVRKTLRVGELPLDCSDGALMLDIHGSSATMNHWSAELNRQLVVSSYATTSFTRNSPVRNAEEDAAHAESVGCGGGRRRAVGR